ncbi:hypothetical protein GLOTRDRAFT_80944 [Gloeophyllum trabeum ATCC 11539]|uniref:Sugar phosphate transporter domain-containing protein n=1 Tax=Gloeophyllum trabeum (strain ATCC 11539 / FP-39264 / Madison 617) TaxID=670483 RepID=S7PWK0_GLOTA|nr:uncharacterized protein GLOTRDRAFT_80944 [Gloeophyllum trabeum ATCC 11539]EPQ51938.1 hypothetical protein GLOTRDRAFT_80944 [Gloeophyllum trabeum ATCC 11539]
MAVKDGEGHSRAAVTGTVLFYLVAALAMVMANKWVLSSTEVPLFFLFTQLVIAVILFLISHAAGLVKVNMDFSMPRLQALAPLVGLNVIGLSFSNFTLKYVDASFYQVARGLVLPFTCLTSFVFLHSRPSLRILLACGVVTLGFFIGVFLDGTPVSFIGVSFGVVSSAVTATHSVVIKRTLDVVKGSALDLSWYGNSLSAIALVPVIILAGEVPGVMKLLFGPPEVTPVGTMTPLATFLWGSAITGVFGFLMSIASLLSIKVTSPITHMVSSAVRGVLATMLGAWLFHEIVTTGRVASIATILGGSIWYTWIKHVESQQARPDPSKGPYERVPMEEVEAGRANSPHAKPE